MTYATSSDHENIGKTISNMKKNQITTLAGKEDNRESTATKTTAPFTSSCDSEWHDYMSDLMIEPTLNNHTYGFGRRIWAKPAGKWRTPAPKVCKKGQSLFKLNTSGHFQARTTQGVFMFGSTAQGVTKIKRSLPAVQKLPGHQKVSEVQVKTTKKPGRWFKFEKSKVDTKKTQETSGTGGTTRRRWKHRTKPRITDIYKTHNQELKMEESK